MDQNIINDANDEWRGCLLACVQAKGGHFDFEQLLWQYSATWRDVSAFVKCDTIFRLFFFGNYHKFERLNFARYCGNILKVWWEMSCGFCWKFTSLSSFHQWNNFENLLRIDKSYCHEFGVLLFWDTVYIVIQTAKLKIYSQYRQSL